MASLENVRVKLPKFHGIRRHVRYHLRTVFLWPLIVGLVASYVLAATPQAREVYLALYVEANATHTLIGIFLVVLLSLQLDTWHRMLGKAAIDRIYPEHADIGVDRRLAHWNTSISRLAAVVPLAALAMGTTVSLLNGYKLEAKIERVEKAVAAGHAATGPAQPVSLDDTLIGQVLVPTMGFVAACLVLGVATWLGAYKERQPDPIRIAKRYRRAIIWVTAVIATLGLLLPLVGVLRPYVVPIAQVIGPLGAIAITFITLVSFLMLLTYASSVMRLPVMGVALSLVAAGLAYQLYASLHTRQLASKTPFGSRERSEFSDDKRKAKSEESKRHFNKAFDDWLEARPDRDAFKSTGYPVFIVAAQGGGIYASAAALSFLTAMEDDCPGFSQHVFAVSGVSGGAVGAAVFNALMADAHAVAEPCKGGIDDKLSDKAAAIVERDHLSPALLQIWPDQLGKLGLLKTVPLFAGHFDRATVLERSFACAFDALSGPVWACGAASGGSGLRVPFEQHWDPTSIARPALIMNATWGETGYRAAFAPFQLHAISDHTIFVFPSASQPGDFEDSGLTPELSKRSLVEAAFVSARFPGIVPTYQLEFKPPAGGEAKIWNFVDGGYVDNSGATTATELYKALSDHFKREADKSTREASEEKSSRAPRPRIFLILLTDVTTDPDVMAVESGTNLQDTVAPVTALLNVRSQLADRAVTRAIAVLEADPQNLSGRLGPNSNLFVVTLKQTDFELPLGWKISKRTHGVIKTLLGRPELCDREKFSNWPQDQAERVIVDNSCVKQSLKRILGASP
ncbi:MAG: patatin-like phospholipase family protein [Hyphomicrobium sp.]|jgi:hypothetical protein